ncbi:MAG: hypothetical protein ACFFAS_00355 [Promethearchaeota archaeon]
MINGDVQEGYYDASTNIVHRCVPLNAPNGKKLEGRFKLVDGRLIDQGESWFEAYRDRTVLTQEYSTWQGSTVPVVSLDYYRTISYSLGTRFVALLQEVRDQVVSVAPFDDHFKGSTGYRTKVDPNRFLNPDYDPESQEAVEAREFFESVKDLVNLRMMVKEAPIYLPIGDDLLKKINDGIGLDSFDKIVRKLLSKPIPGVFPGIDAVKWDQDNFVYELFSIGLTNDRRSKYNIYFITFAGTTDKEMFSNWFKLLQNFRSGDFDLNNEIEARIHRALFDNEGNNILLERYGEEGFSEGIDYSEEDISIISDLVEILSFILGRFGFLEMYRGNIFPKYGHVNFVSHTWARQLQAVKKSRLIDFTLYTDRSTGLVRGYTKLYPHDDAFISSPHILRSYYLNEFLSEYTIMRSNTKIEGVSNKLWAPQYIESSHIKSSEIKDHNQLLSYFIFSTGILENSFVEEESIEIESILFKQLYRVIFTRLYSRAEYAYIMRELTSLLGTSNGGKAKNYRSALYMWLGARGTYRLNLDLGLQEANLILDKKIFDTYFAPYVERFALPLSRIQLSNTAEQIAIRNLNYLQDLIIDVINFIQRMADKLDNNGGRKIILYPFVPRVDSWWYAKAENYYEGLEFRLKSLQGDLKEWMPEGSRMINKYGFVVDPNDLSSFERLIPEFLGLLLVKRAGFVVRVVDNIAPSEPNSYLGGEFCDFIFDILGGIIPSDFKGNKKQYSVGVNGLVWKDESIFIELYKELKSILNKHSLLSVGTLNSQDFYNIFRNPSLLSPALKNLRFE